MADFQLRDGLVSINDLWKTDRAMALTLLTDFHDKFKDNYAAGEMVDMAHLAKRMDRQNNVNGGGNPTSVWTSIIVNIKDGNIVEGRLSELYPHGAAVPTYDFAANGRVSKALADADLAAMTNPGNKTNAQGVDTSFEGKSWRDVVSKNFVGQFMEVAPDAPTPDGFSRVVNFMSPPMEAGQAYTPMTLCMRNPDGSSALNAQSYRNAATHLKGFFAICAAEHLADDADVNAYVKRDIHYRNAIRALKALKDAVLGFKPVRGASHRNPSQLRL